MSPEPIQLSFPFYDPLRPKRRPRAKEKAELIAKYRRIQTPTDQSDSTVNILRVSRQEAIEAFTPFEHAVLSDMFKVSRLRIAREIDIWAAEDGDGKPLLKRDLQEYLCPDLALRNAAAEILLKPVEKDLPDYYSLRQRKYVRKPGIGAVGKPITLMPQHVLTINWACSGPGFDWPETYYLTYVPGYDRFVVTASEDSDDIYGCTDFAVGWFRSCRDLKASTGRVLTRFWRNVYETRDQYRWEEIYGEGLLSKDDAKRLADRVWGVEDCW